MNPIIVQMLKDAFYFIFAVSNGGKKIQHLALDIGEHSFIIILN